jgi:prolyl-tRNA editing enzyme YbaK/EbsC (Cys-tRNA(Pro) deacylase)
MAIEQVRVYFEGLGIADRIQEFSVSSATVDLAAEALGVIPDRICKSLSFYDKEGGAIMVCA